MSRNNQTICRHVDALPADRIDAATPQGCAECIELGDDWVHLRLCLTCGHVGCCDNSKNKHGTKHAHATGHPLIQSYQPAEYWLFCYPDDQMMMDQMPAGYTSPPAGADRAHAVPHYNEAKPSEWR